MITGFFSTCLVYAAADLRLADHLALGPLSVGELAARSGGIPFDHVFGKSFFEYLADDARAGDLFNAATGARSRLEQQAVLGSYDFGRFKRIVDVGGGTGGLLAAICARYPAVDGIVFDLPAARAAAEALFAANGLDSRCRFVGGTFFESSLPEGDLIVLSRVLHDWSDERAVAILRRCEQAMTVGGRLLIVDQLLAPGPRLATDAVMLDLHMLATLDGRERTEAEFAELLGAAGLRLLRATATGAPVWLLEGARARQQLSAPAAGAVA
jgi:SAM-dependent methyltransferase